MSVSSVLPAHEICGHEGLVTSPTVGNLVVIMPRAIHASRLRNSLSELSVDGGYGEHRIRLWFGGASQPHLGQLIIDMVVEGYCSASRILVEDGDRV